MAEKKVFINAPLVWVDLEMTGLDPAVDTILEIAVIITDNELNIINEGLDITIHQPESVLESMNDWCKLNHMRSGLTERVQNSTTSMEQAQQQVLDLIKKYCKQNESPLCGNSVGIDKAFLVNYMPQLVDYLHYRIIDVSTVKELVCRWYQEVPRFAKKNNHRAHSDIVESIDELKFYKEKFFIDTV